MTTPDAIARDARFVGTVPELYDRYLGPPLFEDFARDRRDVPGGLTGESESSESAAVGLVQGNPVMGAIADRGTADAWAITKAVAVATQRD
jgi:hypothetical protein